MACGFCATGQAGFDRHLTAGEIVEQVVLAAARRQAGRTATEQRRVHGHGRTARQRGCGVARRRTDPRRPRPVGPPHHGLDRRCRAGHPQARRPPAAGDARRQPARRRRRAARLARAVEPPLSDRRRARGVRRVPRRPRSSDQLRVGDDRRGQRSRQRRRAARRPVSTSAARRPRQPDPAQPDPGLADHRVTAGAGGRVPRAAGGARGAGDRQAQPGHRHRRRLRPARRPPPDGVVVSPVRIGRADAQQPARRT